MRLNRKNINASDEVAAALMPASSPTLSATLCIIDDQDAMLKMLSTLLKRISSDIRMYSSPEDALRDLPTLPPKTIFISDIDMGNNMNGIRLAEMIKQERSDAFILLMSGMDHDQELKPLFQNKIIHSFHHKGPEITKLKEVVSLLVESPAQP